MNTLLYTTGLLVLSLYFVNSAKLENFYPNKFSILDILSVFDMIDMRTYPSI